MGEVIRIDDYLERKTSETPRADLTRRIAEIATEMLVLQSEKNRLERQLLQPPPDNIA